MDQFKRNSAVRKLTKFP